jgi:hypothetical protein
MRSRAPSLPTPFALCLRTRNGTLDGADRRQIRNRFCCGSLLGGEEHCFAGTVACNRDLVEAARVLGLALLPNRQQRCCDEDRRVSAGRDADHQREREVLQRVAAEEQ